MTTFGDGNVYEKLGVRAAINAIGAGTVFGGSGPPEVVRKAMEDASKHFVKMDDLLEKAGEYIAETLGAEAAYVTSGGAAALTLSAAACIAGTDLEKIDRLPDTAGMKSEIIIQNKHRSAMDRCFTLPGGQLVEVGDEGGCTAQQIEEAIGPNTAAIAYWVKFIDREDVDVSLEDTVKVARKHNVPVIADAAGHVYPLGYFRSMSQSADLVCNGSKYFGGPNAAGFVCGRKDLVDAVALQGFVAFHLNKVRVVGRGMKLDRQQIVAVVAALDNWFSMDHEERFQTYERWFATIQERLRGIPHVKTRVVQRTFNGVPLFCGPGLDVVLDVKALGKNAQQVEDELYEGSPSIMVRASSEDTVGISADTLNEGDQDIIADRLRSVLSS